jgi:hypothetical protein
MAQSVTRITGDPVVVKGTEVASSAWKKGDLVQFDANGLVAIAASDVIDGIARGDASGVTGAVCEVELIDPGAVYVGYYSTTTVQTIVGNIADFDDVTAGAMKLTTGGTTDAVIVGLDPRDAVGTSGGRVFFRFHGTLFNGR